MSHSSISVSAVKIEDEDSGKRKKPPAELIDVKEVIDRMRKADSFFFLYLVHGVSRMSEFYSPYSLKLRPSFLIKYHHTYY